MKTVPLLSLAALLVGVALPPKPAPLWTAELRIGGNPEVAPWCHVLGLGEVPEAASLLGDGAVLRAAGFDDASTPGPDWIAEVRDVADMPKLVQRMATRGIDAGEGRFRIGEGAAGFVAWQESATTLRLASTPAAAALDLPATTGLQDGTWLAAWVDLSQMAPDTIQSATLKLPRAITVTASSAAGGTTVELGATLASDAMAGRAKSVADTLRAALLPIAPPAETGAPPLEVSVSGQQVTLRLHLSDAELHRLLSDATASPPGK